MESINFLKYGKIKQLGHKDCAEIFSNPEDDIYLQEKIDGANTRFIFKDNKLIFGSRNRQLTSDNGNETNVDKNFKKCLAHINEKVYSSGVPLSKFEHFIFYGECCTKHSICYNWEDMPPYLGFDIYDRKDQVYLNQDVAKKVFKDFGLEFVPCLEVKKAGDIKEFSDKDMPKSMYYSGQVEGIIFKNYTKQIMAKYVTDKFKEVNKNTFGLGKKWATNDNEIIVAKYCTNPRIDKIIFKCVDDGNELEMGMMKHLPIAVYTDIMEEEGQEILFSNFSINFQDLRKQITRRCLAVLKSVMVNNALNNETNNKKENPRDK